MGKSKDDSGSNSVNIMIMTSCDQEGLWCDQKEVK